MNKVLGSKLKNEPYGLIGRFWPLILAILVTAVAVSGESYWIDEGNAMTKAQQSSLSEWVKSLTSEGGSDSQMPGYMLFIWAWEKMVGSGEWVMRFSNVIWLAIGIFGLRFQPRALGFLLICPFTFYYLNELRPYAMQIGASCLLLGSVKKIKDEEGGEWQYLVGLLLLCASSLLGVIFSAAFIVYVALLLRPQKAWQQLGVKALISSPVFALLGLYYLWTIKAGYGAASMSGNPVLSLAQSGYELLGFAGLGPGRIELRESISSIKSYLVFIVPMAGLTMFVCVQAFLSFRKNVTKRDFSALVLVALFLGVSLVSLIVLKDFRLLGRHLSPLVPVVALFLMPNRELFRSRKAQCTLLLFLFFTLMSSLMLRFADRHRKDDYKHAAELAIAEQKPIYWLADKRTGEVYGISEDNEYFKYSGSWSEKLEIENDSIVVLSKPDLYDSMGQGQKMLSEAGFKKTRTLQGFWIFAKEQPK